MGVADYDRWNPDRQEWKDPRFIFIFWGLLPEKPPAGRRAAYVFRFTESVGDPELLTSNQQRSMREFAHRAQEPDLILCGNPVIADYWSFFCKKVAAVPAGYEASVLGTPNWDLPKEFDFCFRGSLVGRREWLLEQLQERFRDRFIWIKDFGASRKRWMDKSKVDLYLGHSDDYAFPGMRLWQSISTSSALILERRNAWPALPGRHYIPIDPILPSNFKTAFEELGYLLKFFPLEEIARTAHQDLSIYTIDHCMNLLVAQTMELA